jgi:hypothetical protein
VGVDPELDSTQTLLIRDGNVRKAAQQNGGSLSVADRNPD